MSTDLQLVRVCFGAMVRVCACLNFPTMSYVEGSAIDSEYPPAILSVPLSRLSHIRRACTLPVVDGRKVNGRFRLAIFNRRPSGVHTGASRVGKIHTSHPQI